MFLSKLLIGGIVCVGCGIPVAYELLKGKGRESEEFVFNKIDEVSRPILSCKGEKSHIELFLAYKKGLGGKDELQWKGFDRNKREYIDLEETIETIVKDKKWRLNIFEIGTTQIGMLDGRMEGNYEDEAIECNQDVFEVTKWTYQDGDKKHWSWEGPVTKVQLTLDNCKIESGKKECDIKIFENVGLAFKPTFRSRVIFLT